VPGDAGQSGQSGQSGRSALSGAARAGGDKSRGPGSPLFRIGRVMRGDLVVLRPVVDEDVPELSRIRAAEEVVRWWGAGSVGAELADSDSETLAILHEDRVVGAIQWHAEEEPDFRHAGMDLYLDPALHGRGLGTDAVRTLARYLTGERGFHRLIIDPAADNAAAIRAYTKVGFQPVGVMRQYWRDPSGVWRDGLLLDLLAAELC
jgi:aminoglycoside 6'-N-acetyltransferase